MFFLCHHTNTLVTSVSDMTAIDYPEYKSRFYIVYNLLSPHYNIRIRIKTSPLDETTPISSLTPIFKGVN
jgi:NADH-quinone oxidoreductase subunit C